MPVVVAVAAAALGLGQASPASVSTTSRATSDAGAAVQGLADAVLGRRLARGSARRYGAILARTLSRMRRMDAGRAAVVGSVLHDVAVQAPAYSEPRALALFAMLETNAAYLTTHPLSGAPGRIRGSDGVVYPFVPGHGYAFHPLANVVQLNRDATGRRTAAAARLAAAFVARGVRAGSTRVWEYYFPFGGPRRWTSGFVQAVAAQALARTAVLTEDPAARAASAAALRAIPTRLARPLGRGLWIREYSFSDSAILNAQLQSLLSIRSYLAITGDADGRALARRLAAAAATLLPQFDTGRWSRYELGGGEASLKYHTYHVWLLEQLATRAPSRPWAVRAARWRQYLYARIGRPPPAPTPQPEPEPLRDWTVLPARPPDWIELGPGR
jgi:hypothetical protein